LCDPWGWWFLSATVSFFGAKIHFVLGDDVPGPGFCPFVPLSHPPPPFFSDALPVGGLPRPLSQPFLNWSVWPLFPTSPAYGLQPWFLFPPLMFTPSPIRRWPVRACFFSPDLNSVNTPTHAAFLKSDAPPFCFFYNVFCPAPVSPPPHVPPTPPLKRSPFPPVRGPIPPLLV